MYYDLIGQPLAQTFSSSTPGLSQSFSNPANILTSAQLPRYTTFFAVPSAIVPAAPAGGLPLVYPYGAGQSGSFAITNSIDQQLAAPYTINLDFTIGRDLARFPAAMIANTKKTNEALVCPSVMNAIAVAKNRSKQDESTWRFQSEYRRLSARYIPTLYARWHSRVVNA